MFKSFQFGFLIRSYVKINRSHNNTKFISCLPTNCNNNNHINRNRKMLLNIERGFENVRREWRDTELGSNYRAQHLRFQGRPFTVMSYNVLAQVYVRYHQDLYNNIHPNFLRWNHRLGKILSEIYKTKPHILCLQEVEDLNYPAIKAGLKDLNYKGIYFRRTGDKSDGCAIFVNKEIFHIEEHRNLKLVNNQEPLLARDNIAILVKLSLKSNRNKSFVVANTHLLYNPKRDDIRLAQLQSIFMSLKDFAQSRSSGPSPVILVGDFNFPPSSSLFEFVTQGEILWNRGLTKACQEELRAAGKNDEKPKATDIANQFRKTALSDTIQTITHSMNLESASTKDQLKDRATTYHREWITVDHIFYTKETESSLKLLSTLLPPDIKHCYPIPNGVFGSDHHCVAANFLLT